MSGSTFWHGASMDEWANAWTRYYTGGQGNYMIAGMEDTGTLQSLTFLDHADRADLRRVLVLRTVSNYDRQPPGASAAEDLKDLSPAVTPPISLRSKRPRGSAIKWCATSSSTGRTRIDDSTSQNRRRRDARRAANSDSRVRLPAHKFSRPGSPHKFPVFNDVSPARKHRLRHALHA